MAQSTCIKCGGTRFVVVPRDSIPNAASVLHFVQCAECGGVVGVIEGVSQRLANIEKALRIKQQ
jgi:hypothetical protein